MIDTRAATDTEPTTEADRPIVCRRCSAAITTEAARTSRNGSHMHTRINPYGWVFALRCFSDAPGCRPVGEPTEEHTWFAGFAWRIGECRACGAHLGWRFDGAGDSFFGLILDALS